jgi:hypothetical protein
LLPRKDVLNNNIILVLLYKDYYEGEKEAEVELVEALYKAKP